MKFNFRLTLIFLLITSGIYSQTETCLQNLNHPNLQTITQITSSETIVREYILYIPQDYNENTASPLVINMHGFGDCAGDYAETIGSFYNFNELADQENFIVAYPQGAYRIEKEDTYWEPGDNGAQNIYTNDIYFLEELISDIQSEFNVDPNKIYACGYSNGGMMSYSLACNRSNLIAAIGIMSGTMLAEDCTLYKAVPIIKFHGIADQVLPYEGNVWYQSVEEVVNFWLDLNNIPGSSLVSTPLNDGDVVRDVYSGGDDNSCLTLYTINEEFDKPGDHVWFSEAIDGISPNKIMWDFFNENCGTISSTNELSANELDLVIHPNPFIDQITIETNQFFDQEFSILDVNGNLLLKGILNSPMHTIDLTELPAKLYILNIQGLAKRLIKIN